MNGFLSIFKTVLDMAYVAGKKIAIAAPLMNIEFLKLSGSYDGYGVEIQEHTILAYRGPVRLEDGRPIIIRHNEVANFIRDYNKSNGLSGENALKFITLSDDNEVRKKLTPNEYTYSVWLNHLTRPSDLLKPVDGVGQQQLVHRVLYLYGSDGKLREICPVKIAPSGMVPKLPKARLERRIGAEGIKRLEQLRGREIYEKGEEIVDVADVFGNPQITFDHEAVDEYVVDAYGTIPHSHHVYTSGQYAPERVGLQGAGWAHHGGRGCFGVTLDVGPADSYSYRSFPLVRGEDVKGKITRPSKQSYEFSF